MECDKLQELLFHYGIESYKNIEKIDCLMVRMIYDIIILLIKICFTNELCKGNGSLANRRIKHVSSKIS